jgi:hypothetical protein
MSEIEGRIEVPNDRPGLYRQDRGPLRLPKVRRWSVYFISFGVWLTGAVWLIYHYFLWTEGKFGHVRHPLEAWWLKAHGLFSFWSVWMFYVDGKGWRAGTSLVHWILGLIALVVFLIHWLSKSVPKRS